MFSCSNGKRQYSLNTLSFEALDEVTDVEATDLKTTHILARVQSTGLQIPTVCIISVLNRLEGSRRRDKWKPFIRTKPFRSKAGPFLTHSLTGIFKSPCRKAYWLHQKPSLMRERTVHKHERVKETSPASLKALAKLPPRLALCGRKQRPPGPRGLELPGE